MPSGGEGSGPKPIFISYRRDDAVGHARSLFEKLSQWFGSDKVYFDLDSIEPGAPFSQDLDSAVRAASVTLAVIAKDWLTILNQRAGQAGEDVVRQELRLALKLRSEDETRLVVPVLMGGAPMFAAHELGDAVRGDLAGLCSLDAVDLGGKQARWEHDIHHLVARIRDCVGLRPKPKLTDAERLEHVRVEVAGLMVADDLRPLRETWGEHPPLDASSDALDLVLNYTTGVEDALEAWRKLGLNPDRAAEVKLKCQKILALLYGLAVDGAEARFLLSSEAGAVPVASAATLAVAYGAQEGQITPIAPLPSGVDDFRSPGTADLNAPDRGAGLDDRTHVHQVLWAATFGDPFKPYPSGGNPLDERNRLALRTRLESRRRRRKADCLLTGIAPAGTVRSPVLDEVGADLGVVALLRTGCAGKLLTVSEAELNNHVAECLDIIESIQ